MRKAVLKKRSVLPKKNSFINEFAGLESSEHAQTLAPGMQNTRARDDFQVNPIYKSNKMRTQSLEHRGKTSLLNLRLEHTYHTPLYQDLLTKVLPLRAEYRKLKELEARQQMASEELGHWNGYLENRKQEIENLPQVKEELEKDIDYTEDINDSQYQFSHKIKPGDDALMREFFDRFKDHKTHRISSDRLTKFHGEYSKMYRFGVPLAPKNLAQLTHPFYGYLTAFPGLSFTYEELRSVYVNQIASSYEKTFGQELLSEELSCLSFWLLADPNQKGWLSLQEAVPLLKALRFSHMFEDQWGKEDDNLTLSKLKQEFKFNLKAKPGELLELDGRESIIRFDLIRDIFLERGL